MSRVQQNRHLESAKIRDFVHFQFHYYLFHYFPVILKKKLTAVSHFSDKYQVLYILVRIDSLGNTANLCF